MICIGVLAILRQCIIIPEIVYRQKRYLRIYHHAT